MLTDAQLQALGLSRADLTDTTVLEPTGEDVGEGGWKQVVLGVMTPFMFYQLPQAQWQLHPIEAPAARRAGVHVERSLNPKASNIHVAFLPEHTQPEVVDASLGEEPAYYIGESDPTVVILDDRGVLRIPRPAPFNDVIFGGRTEEEPGGISSAPSSGIAVSALPRVEAPLAALRASCPDPWLAQQIAMRQEIGHAWDHVAAMGMYRRLLRPSDRAATARAAAALLQGEPDEFWTEVDRVRRWLRGLTSEQLEGLETLTETTVDFLELDLRQLRQDLFEDGERVSEDLWVQALLDLCHDRDDAEGARLLLAEVGRQESIQDELELFDLAGSQFMNELTGTAEPGPAHAGPAAESSPEHRRPRLRRPIEDERLRRVFLSDPGAWWARPAAAPEEESAD